MTDHAPLRRVRAIGRALLGDRIGWALFLGALLVFGLVWRVGPTSPDVATAANTLVALEDGHLYVDQARYAVGEDDPLGLRAVDGRWYGRAYAQTALALPFLAAVQAVTVVVDPRLAIAVGWGLVGVAFVRTLGSFVGHRRDLTAVGALVAATVVAVEFLVGPPATPEDKPLLALGLSTLLAGALIPVLVYRLVRSRHRPAVATSAGVAVVVATPVPMWASVPRHHTLVALFALTVAWAFHRNRQSSGPDAARVRALAYVAAGATLWLEPVDGLVLLSALAAVDLATGRRSGTREWSVVAGGLALSAVPAAVTAALTAGVSLDPLRSWAASWQAAAVLDPGNLFGTFVRSEFTATPVAYATIGPLNLKVAGAPVALSVLEAMPLAGLLVAAPALLVGRYRAGGSVIDWNPLQPTDLLVVTYLALLVAARLPEIPAQSSITLRHLHPVYPMAVYLLARVPIVREAVDDWGFLTRTYASFVGTGLLAAILGGFLLTSGPHDLARLNGMVGFVVGAVLVYWGAVAPFVDGDHAGSTAVGLAAGGAVTTIFVLLSAFVYFPAERYALAASRLVAESLTLW